MTNALVITPENDLDITARLRAAGQTANQFAVRGVFANYRDRKAHNTLDRQAHDLARFAEYLAAAGVQAGDLSQDAEAWRGVTWGLVEGFVKWQIQQGFAIGSINVRLSTVKVYARLALKAGSLTVTDEALIRAVQGYRHVEGKRLDERREETRRGHKKATATVLTPEQAAALKAQPDTPQGRRDAVLMGLLLNLGLRAGEVVGVRVQDVDVKSGYLTFYRQKVDKTQTHQLVDGLWSTVKAYIEQGDAPREPEAPLLRASHKHGDLTTAGLTRFGLSQRVQQLGVRLGLEHLSPHDCRHYWATMAARHGTPLDRLQDAGGWASPAMPLRYIEAAAIANEGVKLG